MSNLAIVKWTDNDGVKHEALMLDEYAWKVHLALIREGIKTISSYRV